MAIGRLRMLQNLHWGCLNRCKSSCCSCAHTLHVLRLAASAEEPCPDYTTVHVCRHALLAVSAAAGHPVPLSKALLSHPQQSWSASCRSHAALTTKMCMRTPSSKAELKASRPGTGFKPLAAIQ